VKPIHFALSADRFRRSLSPLAVAGFALMVALGAEPSVAFAQGTIVPEADQQQQPAPQPVPAARQTAPQPATNTPAATAPAAAAQAPATATSQPAVQAQAGTATPATGATDTPAPAQSPPVYTGTAPAPGVPAVAAQGQWVYTDQYGWLWIPEGSTTVYVQEQPYVYLYTPTYGWTWYGSPWGPGRYYYGPWVHHAWGAPRVWHRGGWYAPHVVVRPRVYAAPRVYRGGAYHHRR